MYGFCVNNGMLCKWKEVYYIGFKCCKHPILKDTVAHHLQCPYLPNIRMLREGVEYIFPVVYTAGHGSKHDISSMLLYQVNIIDTTLRLPHSPVVLISDAQSQDTIGWDNMTREKIYNHCNR